MAQPNIRSVIKVGSSLAVIIPSNIAASFGLAPGDQVIFAVYAPGVFSARKVSEVEISQLKPPIIDV